MSSLFLNGTAAPRVKVLPVVYFSVLDHYLRRGEGQERVIGTLLGSVMPNGVIEVTNCFPVPHNETEEQVAVDMEYHRTMLELYQRVNDKEEIVGWYATGNSITEHSTLIHDFYAREAETPVHLLIDASVHNQRMNITAVVSTAMGIPNGTQGTLFTPVQCDVQYHEPERIGIELMTRSLSTPSNGAALITDLDHVKESTESLQKMLNICLEYVKKVVSGEIVGDERIGRFLLDTISAVPKVDAAQFEKTFNNVLQDLLMVVYLANLTRSQVILQEKLNDIL